MRTLFDLTAGELNVRAGKWRFTASPWRLRFLREGPGDRTAGEGSPDPLLTWSRRLVLAAIAVWALVLCWKGVSWAFRPRTFPVMDEVSDLTWLVRTTYARLLHLFPEAVLFDRPVGFIFVRFLFDQFGFQYRPWLICLLSIHAVNCIQVFALLRRLGNSLPLALAGLAAFGCLWPTPASTTYMGGTADTICTFFLLASTLALLSERRWQWYLSAGFYLLALRSKEWGIVIPVVLTVLVIVRYGSGLAPRQILREIGKRLWAHYLVLLVFGGIYLSLARQMRTGFGESTPYHMVLRPGSILESYVYYTSLITGADVTSAPWIAFAAFLAILVYALIRRRGMMVFASCAYLVTLLPVSLIPHQRIPYYAYGPQIFVILLGCLFLQDLVDLIPTPARLRWSVAAGTALLALCPLTLLRQSGMYANRIHFTWMVRETCWRSARDAAGQLSSIGPGASIYMDSRNADPWLFIPGPGGYLRMMRNDNTLKFTLSGPGVDLRALYDKDPGEKYLMRYQPDGSLITLMTAPQQGAPAASK